MKKKVDIEVGNGETTIFEWDNIHNFTISWRDDNGAYEEIGILSLK